MGLPVADIVYLISNKNLIKRFIKLKSMHEISYFWPISWKVFLKIEKLLMITFMRLKKALFISKIS